MNTLTTTSSEAQQIRLQADSRLADAAREREVLRGELRKLADSVRDLQAEKVELLLRVKTCEAQVKKLLFVEPEAIIAGMRHWLLRDEVGLANAIRSLVSQALP